MTIFVSNREALQVLCLVCDTWAPAGVPCKCDTLPAGNAINEELERENHMRQFQQHLLEGE